MCGLQQDYTSFEDLQERTEGPQRTFKLTPIKRTFVSTARLYTKATKKRIHKTIPTWFPFDVIIIRL